MQAWVASDPYSSDGAGAVVFAEQRGKARWDAARELDCEYTDVRLRRAPEFDAYTPVTLTARVLVSHGWWVPCENAGCGRMCFEDEVAFDGEWAYCGAACRDEDVIRQLVAASPAAPGGEE